MRLESARALKEELVNTELQGLFKASRELAASVRGAGGARAMRSLIGATDFPLAVHDYALAASPVGAVLTAQRTMAIGLSAQRKGPQDYQIALRVQRRALLSDGIVESIRKRSRKEVDVRYVGRIAKRVARKVSATLQLPTGHQRPLRLGCSVGHFQVTAGTLGAFVRSKDDEILLLSNNHVLANEDRCRKGDAVLQPGRLDGGRHKLDRVARLRWWQRLTPLVNLVDAATAELLPDVGHDGNRIPISARRVLAPFCGAPVDIGQHVFKLGRTTDLTRGRLSAFEIDNLVVAYDSGNLRFDNQIEVEAAGRDPFSDGGDSGSLVVGPDGVAVGLLFAGTESGGYRELGVTYLNPIDIVLKTAGVKLLT